MSDPYETLGVGHTAKPDEVKSAYKSAVRSAHPDKGGSDAAMAEVAAAWAILSDPESRAHYDATGEAPEQAPPVPPEETLFLKALSQALMNYTGDESLLAAISDNLRADLENARAEYDSGREALARYRDLLGRFERVDDEVNLIESTLTSSADKIEAALGTLSDKITTHEKALTIVRDYRDTKTPESDIKDDLYKVALNFTAAKSLRRFPRSRSTPFTRIRPGNEYEYPEG